MHRKHDALGTRFTFCVENSSPQFSMTIAVVPSLNFPLIETSLFEFVFTNNNSQEQVSPKNNN